MDRIIVKELMDDPRADVRDLEHSLAFIRWVNVRLGGIEGALKPLRAWAPAWPKRTPMSVLDIGTGSADIPVAIKRWAMAAGLDVRVTGLEKHPKTLQLAKQHVGGIEGVTLVQGDALSLVEQFGPASFDYVHAGMFLHHLQNKDVERVLIAMDRVARRGIIWNDLLRTPFALRAIKVITMFRAHCVRHDAIVSVRAGFVRSEVEALASAAGITYGAYEQTKVTQRFTYAGQKPAPTQPATPSGGSLNATGPAPFKPQVHVVGARKKTAT